MALLKFPGLFQNLKSIMDVSRFLTQWAQEVINEVNGRLEFVLNIRAAGPYTVVFTAPNVDVAVAHNLGGTPLGFLVINTSAAMSVYQGAQEWTGRTVYLKSSAIGSAIVYLV